jgi:hypothetical protein
MIYYGKPGPFDRSVEERIHATVRALMEETEPGRSTT